MWYYNGEYMETWIVWNAKREKVVVALKASKESEEKILWERQQWTQDRKRKFDFH